MPVLVKLKRLKSKRPPARLESVCVYIIINFYINLQHKYSDFVFFSECFLSIFCFTSNFCEKKWVKFKLIYTKKWLKTKNNESNQLVSSWKSTVLLYCPRWKNVIMCAVMCLWVQTWCFKGLYTDYFIEMRPMSSSFPPAVKNRVRSMSQWSGLLGKCCLTPGVADTRVNVLLLFSYL